MTIALIALAWASFGLGAVSTAAVRMRRASRRVMDASAARSVASAVLLRPCAGAEPGLAQHLTSIAYARRSFPISVRVAVARSEDPARPVAEASCAQLVALGWDARVVVTDARGPNLKVAQLAGLVSGTDAEVVLWADSDVDLTGVDLDALVAPLADPSVGATWAPPVERGPVVTLGDRAAQAVLGGSLHCFPLLRHIDPRGMVGKLVAARTDVLAAVGFATMVDVLGEDVELARRLRRSGRRVEAAPIVAIARPRGRTLRTVLDRFSRWAVMVRAQRPWHLLGYPALFAFFPLVAVLAALGAASSPTIASSAFVIALATRIGGAVLAARLSQRGPSIVSRLVDVVLADAVLSVAFARAVCSNRLSWRGRALRLGPGGRLQAASPTRTRPSWRST